MKSLKTVPELHTQRFRLRGLREGDVDAFAPSFADEDVMRYWGRGPIVDRDELRDWLFSTEWPGMTWIAEPLEGGEAVCRVVATIADGSAEIGYFTAMGNERRGIARECVSAMIDHLISGEKVHRIWADVDPRNAASNRLLEQLGFTHEGHLREAAKTHIGWCDSLIWGLLAREWSEHR